MTADDVRERVARALAIPLHDAVCSLGSDCRDDVSTYPKVPDDMTDAVLASLADPVVVAGVNGRLAVRRLAFDGGAWRVLVDGPLGRACHVGGFGARSRDRAADGCE